MKLTKQRLHDLILEVMEERTAFKTNSERENHLRDQQKRYSKERQARDETYPESLRSLSRGVIAEADLLTDEDEEGFIKIKKHALERLLAETSQNINVEATCNKHGYKSMEQWLRIQDAFSDAKKGTFGDPKK